MDLFYSAEYSSASGAYYVYLCCGETVSGSYNVQCVPLLRITNEQMMNRLTQTAWELFSGGPDFTHEGWNRPPSMLHKQFTPVIFSYLVALRQSLRTQ